MAYNQPGNPFKKTSYISAAKGFNPFGVADELKNNPYAMMAKDFKTVQMGPTSRPATLEDQRAEYQRRIKVNQANKRAAKGGDFEYTNPHTGEVTRARGKLSPKTKIGNFAPEGPTSPAGSGGSNVQQSMKTVDVGGKSRNQGFENPVDYESGRPRVNPDAYNRRKSNRRQRQTRRENKKRARQKRREMEGGFFSRLFGGRLGPREWSRGEF